jgi:endonuclease/exonuclease/phosphatase family metal-dependent hydrolase
MKIVSWNICIDNNYQEDNLVELINNHLEGGRAIDILCLQEVGQACLDYITSQLSQTYHIAYTVNFCRKISRKNQEKAYLVTLSRYPIIEANPIVLHHNKPRSLFSKYLGINTIRRGLSVLIQSTNQVNRNNNKTHNQVQVVNIHLEVAAGPSRRIAEFIEVMNSLYTQDFMKIPAVICGDFNIFSSPLFAWLIGLLLNYTPSDYTTFERKEFEELFKRYKLNNIFSKFVTFRRFGLQLDHILISDNLKSVFNDISNKTYQSDHHQLISEIV